jgi:hypothetical protein
MLIPWLLLSAPLIAQTPGLVLEGSSLFPDVEATGAPTILARRADLLILDEGSSSAAMVRVRTADQQEGFVPTGQLARLAAESDDRRFYLTGHREEGGVLLIMTDLDGAIRGLIAAPGGHGERLHLIQDTVWPGVDALLVVEAYRQSCPGGAQRTIIAQVGDILATVTTATSTGEEGWYHRTVVYRPVRDADGTLRHRAIIEDTEPASMDIRPRPGVLVVERTVHEPWVAQWGDHPYTLDSSTQEVLRWSITPGEAPSGQDL